MDIQNKTKFYAKHMDFFNVQKLRAGINAISIIESTVIAVKYLNNFDRRYLETIKVITHVIFMFSLNLIFTHMQKYSHKSFEQ